MYLSTPTDQRNVETIDALLSALRERQKGQLAAFWMDHNEFPMLFVGVNQGQAWLNFIPESETPGFLSQGSLLSGEPDVEFLDMDGHIDLRPSACVVPLSVAEEAAVEFFTSQSLPKCVNWLEL